MTEAADIRKGPAKYDGSNIISGIGGIQTINGDATPNQFLTGDPAIRITDDGIGGHKFTYQAFIHGFSQTGAPALVTVPSGVETIVGQGTVSDAGWYTVQAVLDNGSVALTGTTMAIARIRAGTGLITDSIIGQITQECINDPTVNEFATNVFSYAVPLNVGVVISITFQFDVGGALPMDVGFRANLIYLGAL